MKREEAEGGGGERLGGEKETERKWTFKNTGTTFHLLEWLLLKRKRR